MDFEDFLEPEVGIAAAVVAAIASPQVRNVLRRGAVYGLTGVLLAGDAVSSFAKGVGQGAQNVASATAQRVNVQVGNGSSNGSSTANKSNGASQEHATTETSSASTPSGELAGGEI